MSELLKHLGRQTEVRMKHGDPVSESEISQMEKDDTVISIENTLRIGYVFFFIYSELLSTTIYYVKDNCPCLLLSSYFLIFVFCRTGAVSRIQRSIFR